MTIWPFTNSGEPTTLDDCRSELAKQRKRADDNHKRWKSAEATLVMVRQERDRVPGRDPRRGLPDRPPAPADGGARGDRRGQL